MSPTVGTVGVVTQARTGSTRLPAKVLLEVAGRTVLDHHLDRLGATGLPVVVATTTAPADDAVAALADRRGVEVFRGSEHDVLDRFDRCASAHEWDGLVRVTSDCPLLDAAVVRDAVALWAGEDDVYVSNGLRRTFPRGYDVEVLPVRALHEAARRATEPAEREHVTPWLYARPAAETGLRLRSLERDEDASDLRVTLDTPDDLRLVRALLEDHDGARLGVDEVVAVLRSHPDLVALNAHVEQKPLAASRVGGAR